MTVDDDNSIYVGGLPYDSTEDSLRKVFNLYGAVVAVKIINDREVGGKCYGFVTFTNPRSAVDAINDMNGRTIGGRVVRVNEVRTRGGRPNFNRERFHRDVERDVDWERDRDRERDHYRGRDRNRDRNFERFRDRDREREIDYEHGRAHDRTKDRGLDRDQDRDWEDNDEEQMRSHDRDLERDHDMDWNHDRDVDRSKDSDRSKDKDKEKPLRNRLGSGHSNDRRSREFSSNSSDEYYDQLKEQLAISLHRREELQKEIPLMEEKIEDKQRLVFDLQKNSLKLEDALAAAKKLCSQRKSQLIKMQKCVLQVQEYNEKLKSCELELKSLVDAAMREDDVYDDAGVRDSSLYMNGQA